MQASTATTELNLHASFNQGDGGDMKAVGETEDMKGEDQGTEDEQRRMEGMEEIGVDRARGTNRRPGV